MDAIGRMESEQSGFHGPREGLETALLRCGRILIEERSKVMAKGGFLENHVVLFGPIQFNQAQIWLGPVDAIAAFAAASYLFIVAVKSCSASISRVHTKEFAVANNRPVFHIVGRLYHRWRRLGLMQL